MNRIFVGICYYKKKNIIPVAYQYLLTKVVDFHNFILSITGFRELLNIKVLFLNLEFNYYETTQFKFY